MCIEMHSPRWIIASVCLFISINAASADAQVPSRSSPSFILRPKNVTQVVHSTVTFNCQADGALTPTIKWVKYTDSGETYRYLRTSGRFIIGDGSRYLYILGVHWSDAGRYGCVAQNYYGRIVADAYLTVISEGPPTWSIKPYNVTLYSGQKYTLPCRTHGYPTAFHMWTKDGSPVPGHGVTAGINDLLFNAAKLSHSGAYTCTAYNVYGSISQTIFVKVVSDPSIVIHPSNTSTVRGAPVTLSCGVVGSENSLSVKWMKNGKNVQDSTLISFTQQTWRNVKIYSLKISKVRKSLRGSYHCVVANAKGSVTSTVAKVSFTRVAIPLTVKVPEPMVTTAEGSNVELKCIFIGSPMPEITWYKDGHELTNRGFQVALNDKCEAILKLSSVMASLSGNYVCKAGYAEGNISVIVKGRSAPEVKPTNQIKEAERDSSVILQFVVMTTVLPDITWYKDGEELYNVTSTRRHSNSTYHTELAITSVQYKDSGFYTCIAQNQFGVSSGNVTLAVKGRPEAPTNVTVKLTSPDIAVVSWVPGFNGGAHHTFTVQCKEIGSNTWMSASETGINATSTELKKGEGWDGSFVFRVTAVNQFGSSEYSEVSVELRGKTGSPQQHTGDKSPMGAIVGGVIGGLLFVACIILAVVVLRRLKKKKASPKQLPTVTYAVVDNQNNTYMDSTGTQQERCDTYSYVTIAPDAAAAMAAGNGQYASIHRPKQWEVPKRNVRLDKTLGSGHFGKVMKGFLKTKQGTQVVAVKMLKENADQQQKKEFLAELGLMKTMAPHPNIVGLVGCATKSDQPFIIVEYCSMGNLRDFLRSSHGNVVYANMAGNSLTLTCRDLLSFAWQCARGMSYLSSQKLVHRDLAARNILVDKGHVCKIADFGLARDIYEKKQYLKLGEAELPLRWMAIESIFQGITTTESDVWSYGILLWEIVTLGANPYPAMSRDDLIEQLRVGYRMPKPAFCSDELYSIMWQCWQQDPKSRPTFLELGKTVHRLMTAQTLSIDLGNYDRSYINATEEDQ